MNGSNLQKINLLLQVSDGFTDDVVEASVIKYVSSTLQLPFEYANDMVPYKDKADNKLVENFKKLDFPLTIELITEFFESMLDKDNIVENGIVFTPEYIAKYIVNNTLSNRKSSDLPLILDPGCGCGIFLSSSTSILHKATGKSIVEILNKSIYGIELDKDNARRCKIILNLLPLFYGESNCGLKLNIKCTDSLKCKWNELFNINKFDFIIGNPPYVNTHDMSKETATFLKKNFVTTKSGVYNIFYAFIEQAFSFIKDNGIISYIVPNNFLTIKSATNLRKYIVERKSLRFILDFANNMIFKPIRTYNCIIQLTKTQNSFFKYSVMDNVENIESSLSDLTFDTMPLNKLDAHGWKLVNKKVRNNLQKIEGQFRSIKEFIRTGIATLKDDVYIVEKDSKGYYKIFAGKRYDFESDIIKRLYKIPELKNARSLNSICRYIIFPYKKGCDRFEIIPENEMRNMYPKVYAYLLKRKNELDSRDKGKPNSVAWYAYGRTQGLNKYGKKLLFPTFAKAPHFSMVDDKYALFCNGYGIFQNGYIELDILQKILNSSLMQYYVSNTSYAIEGGYYCYQKKYIERFSIPYLSADDKEKIRTFNNGELNKFLISKYNLDL